MISPQWDTAGHERFKTITRTYFKGAHGVILVYDVTNTQSFSEIHTWMDEVEKCSSPGITKLLIGNKCDDLENRKVSYEEGQELADHFKINFIETSAKKGTNINESFASLARQMKEIHIQTDGIPVSPGKKLRRPETNVVIKKRR